MSETPETAALAEQKLSTTRVFDAPRDQVWQAWTDPARITGWWGPNGFTAPESTIELDAKAGGVFRLTMVNAEHGIEVPMDAHFIDVVAQERLEYTEPKPCLDEIKSVTGVVTFTEVGAGKTEVGFHVTMETTDQIRELSEAGWQESFDRLATHLAA